jgi:hypothetical protein
MRVFRRLVAASLLAWLAGCNNSVPTSPPTSPTSPSLSAPLSFVVSGILSETVNGVSRPLAGRQVHLYISGTCGPPANLGSGCRVESGRQPFLTDHNGRYTAEVPKSRVFVKANGWSSASAMFTERQPCLASAAVDNDTNIDVQVVPAGQPSTSPPAASPMITGFVYETTPQGRNPLRGVDVWLEAGYEGYSVADTQTDDAGRFFLCRVNHSPVQWELAHTPVLMYVFLSGYQRVGSQAIPGTGDMFLEIELKR